MERADAGRRQRGVLGRVVSGGENARPVHLIAAKEKAPTSCDAGLHSLHFRFGQINAIRGLAFKASVQSFLGLRIGVDDQPDWLSKLEKTAGT